VQPLGPGSLVGIATGYGLDGPGIERQGKKNPGGREIFRTRPDRPWGPPSLHPPPPSAEVENEYSYTSTPPLGPWWPVIG
jgi:hypothetical protein